MVSSTGPGHVKAYREPGGVPVLDRVTIAASFRARLRGLLGRPNLPEREGLLLWRVNGVHSIGMRFAIDVLYLDEQGTVVKVVRSLEPNRLAPASRGAHSCLELAAGAADGLGLGLGSRLRFGA